MKIAYLDTVGGISGDMTLGAFVGAGMPFDELVKRLGGLRLKGFELTASHVERSGIVATKIDVIVTEDQHHHRHLKDIRAIIGESDLPESVGTKSIAIFEVLAEAEAHVHKSTPEKVHFHEVGAVDSIVDIVGTAICLDHFGIQEVYSSPVKLGSGGFIDTQHGRMPIPTPATVEILKNYPTVLTDIRSELTTPTGAAIIRTLSKGTLAMERLRVSSIGYGAGTREIPEVPNLLRVMIGELEPGYGTDELVTVETNIDDMNPEIYPYVIERLLEAGAHDAFVIPVLMKKGRPGALLSVLTERGKLDAVLQILFRETTTLGVRIQPVERRKISRSTRTVSTSFGMVKVKVIQRESGEILVPEFEECKRIAREKGLPLIEVYKKIEREVG
ncbi:MAG: nickel pincer cofactor biosynthesis protein LarC [Ignavibacterium sp.]|jgi:hypothetical protein